MATVIKGVYATMSAMKKSKAKAGDTFMLGEGTPYTLYTYNGEEFETAGVKVSECAGDLGTMPVDDIVKLSFIAHDGKTLKVRKGIKPGEIQFYVPAED